MLETRLDVLDLSLEVLILLVNLRVVTHLGAISAALHPVSLHHLVLNGAIISKVGSFLLHGVPVQIDIDF